MADEKIPIKCEVCGQSFSAKMPDGEIINNLRFSGLIAPHERLVKCICGTPYLLILAGVQVSWNAMQVVDSEIIAQMEGTRILQPKGLIHSN